MTNEKMKHIRRCRECPYFIAQVPLGGRRWGDSCLASAEGTALDIDPTSGVIQGSLELDDAFMEGPDENCPKGFWKDASLPDITAERQAQMEAFLTQAGRDLKDRVDLLLGPGAVLQDKESAIARLVSAGKCRPDVAAEAMSLAAEISEI